MRLVGRASVDLDAADIAGQPADRASREPFEGPSGSLAREQRILALAAQFPTAPKRIAAAALGLMGANAGDLPTALAAAASHFGRPLKPSTRKKVVSEARALLAYGAVDETPLLALCADGATLEAILQAVSRAGLLAATEARRRHLNAAGGGRRRRPSAEAATAREAAKPGPPPHGDRFEREIQVKRFPKGPVAAGGSTLEGHPCSSFRNLGRVRVTGEICIEIEAGSFAQAAAEQERLERVMSIVKEQFPNASLKVRERRRPRGLPSQVAPPDLHVERPRPGPDSAS